MTELYGLREAFIAAAARNAPTLPKQGDLEKEYVAWLQRQPESTKTTWLVQLMVNPRSAVRREILAEFNKGQHIPSWPVVQIDRTIAELEATAEEIQVQTNRKYAEEAARLLAKKLSD